MHFPFVVLVAYLSLLIASLTSSAQVLQTLDTGETPVDLANDWAERSFWQTVDGQAPGDHWEFSEGEVRLVKPQGGNGNLLSPPLPTAFELAWMWKIESGTNTGLKYRVRKFGHQWLGIEYQMIDEAIPLVVEHKGSTASIYDLQQPILAKPLKPAGQWNQARVVVAAGRLTHYLNEVLVASVETTGPVWDAKVALSKFYGNENFGQPTAGDRVMLTDHGGLAAFKDFRFTALSDDEVSKPPVTIAPQLGNGIRNGWVDQTSIVLWTRTTSAANMNLDGPQFKPLTPQQAKQLARTSDEDKIMAAQLPNGASLDQMFGGCPGSAGEVRLTYFPILQRKDAITTPWKTTSAATDFTAQWHLQELKPGKTYAAVIEARRANGESITAVKRGGFRVPPANDEAASSVKFCMTTCHDFIRRDDGMNGHKIYPAMTAIGPQFIVHAGDIEYYDKPDPWAMTIDLMRYKWARIFSLPNNREFYSNHSTYFMKDDHDTLKNDCWPGQTYGSVTFAEGVKLFNDEQFPSRQTRYQTVSWGSDLQIWLLEGRDFRSPNTMPDGPQKTILGAEQKAWLYQTLSESSAPFKLIFSPTPIVGPDRDNKKDNHANEIFAHEGGELRRELSKYPGVIVFCGDRHWQYASVEGTSGLWEFGCGPGSEKHQLGWEAGDERPIHRFLRVAGGFLSGEVARDTADDQPRLTIRHRTVTGESVSEFVFPQSDDESE